MKISRPGGAHGSTTSPFSGWRCCAALMFSVFVAVSVRAAAPELPPLNDPPTNTRLPGKFVWVDLVTPDVDRAEAFYGKLFGWTFRKIGNGDSAYTLAFLGEEPMGGVVQLIAKPGERKQARWIGFISVPNVSEAQRLVLSQGGKVLVSARSLPRRGDLAVFADREGTIFGVMSSSTGDVEDFLTEMGDWIWAQFLSREGGKAASFYAAIGQSTVLEAPKPNGSKRWFLVSQGYARASILEISPNRLDARPGWLGYVRVPDVSSTVALAEKLGGRVLVSPRPGLFDDKVALIADPSGAVFGVLQWDPIGSEEGK
jgi:predicted enzyme related to lactoylglutathione lyase